jgi:competence protein ComEC
MPDVLAVNFMDVGQGDCTFVRLQKTNGTVVTWLVDFGEKRSKSKVPARDALRGLIQMITHITKRAAAPFIDYLVITHCDGDHWNKLDWLIDGKDDQSHDLWHAQNIEWASGTKMTIKNLIIGGAAADYGTGDVKAAIWAAAGGAAEELGDNEFDKNLAAPKWPIEDNVLQVNLLGCNYPNKSGATNNRSVVLLFTYITKSNVKYGILLSGDAEKELEAEIEKNFRGKLDYDYMALKLSHHGSAASSIESYLKLVKPKAVFATGDEAWTHPYCAPIERVKQLKTLSEIGKNVYYTCGVDKDYSSKVTDLSICTNIWYVYKGDFDIDWQDANGQTITVEPGTYLGVEWTYWIKLDVAKPWIGATNQVPLCPQTNLAPAAPRLSPYRPLKP